MFIGGDIHSFWATDLKADFNHLSSATVATEFVTTSITSEPPPYELFQQVLPENPHVRYFESHHRGYVAVELKRDRMETRFQVISERRDPAATVSTLKRFFVESEGGGCTSVNCQAQKDAADRAMIVAALERTRQGATRRWSPTPAFGATLDHQPGSWRRSSSIWIR